MRQDRLSADEAAAVRRGILDCQEDWAVLARGQRALHLPVSKLQAKSHRERVRRIVAAKMIGMGVGPEPAPPRLLPGLGALAATGTMTAALVYLELPVAVVALSLLLVGMSLQVVGRAVVARL